MAQKRMIRISIIDDDMFLDMPKTTQCLYFHLCMRADDDGFIDAPKKIMRIVGCNDDDMKLLIAKRYLIPFESGVLVIKHWRLHNTIRKEVYKETRFLEEKSSLTQATNGEYLTDDEVKNKALNQEKITMSQKCHKNVTKTVTNMSQECHKNVPLDIDIDIDLDIDKELDINKEISNKNKDILDTSVVEIDTHDLENRMYPAISMILKDNSVVTLTDEEIQKYIEVYNDIDVVKELNKMSLWLESNPAKRKTSKGLNKFIVNWFNRTPPKQEEGGFAF